jgi:hypothetical protein
VGDQLVQPLERERQVRAALVARHRVDLIHDHGADVRQPGSARRRGEQDEQRLGRGDEDVRWPLPRLAPLVRGRVARAHRGADHGGGQAGRHRGGGELGERLVQVAPHVVGEGLQRRDVEDMRAIVERPGDGLAEELIDTGEEGGERLAGARRRSEEDVLAGGDQGPGLSLDRGGLRKPRAEPALDDGVEHPFSIGSPSRAG